MVSGLGSGLGVGAVLGCGACRAVLLVAGIGGVAVSAASRTEHRATGPGPVPGLQTGPAPWTADPADLAARLQAIGVPPLSPMEGTAVHLHQHLDLYADGHKVPVPAGIGIDPAVGFAPLHTHTTPAASSTWSLPPCAPIPWGSSSPCGGAVHPKLDLGGYCAAGGRRLWVYVNGAAYDGDPTTLSLESHQELVVAFGTAAQLPSPIPSAYRFPPGE